MKKNARTLSVDALDEAQLSALDEVIYRSNIIEPAKARGGRGFRVQGRFYFYFFDANHAARIIALRLVNPIFPHAP